MTEMIRIDAPGGGSFAAYYAAPTTTPAPGPAPGLVLIQYICGVNRVMRETADAFAKSGYLVVVPDLFWRQEPGVSLIDDPAKPTREEHRKALALNDGFDDALGVADLQAALTWLRRQPGCSGKVGALGYCLGGRLAYLLATRSDSDCTVGYYGVNIEAYLQEAAGIRAPLMLHLAELDTLCPAAARAQIMAALDGRRDVVLHLYPGAGHAFALSGGGHFHREAAALANRRSEEFLARHLDVAPAP